MSNKELNRRVDLAQTGLSLRHRHRVESIQEEQLRVSFHLSFREKEKREEPRQEPIEAPHALPSSGDVYIALPPQVRIPPIAA